MEPLQRSPPRRTWGELRGHHTGGDKSRMAGRNCQHVGRFPEWPAVLKLRFHPGAGLESREKTHILRTIFGSGRKPERCGDCVFGQDCKNYVMKYLESNVGNLQCKKTAVTFRGNCRVNPANM